MGGVNLTPGVNGNTLQFVSGRLLGDRCNGGGGHRGTPGIGTADHDEPPRIGDCCVPSWYEMDCALPGIGNHRGPPGIACYCALPGIGNFYGPPEIWFYCGLRQPQLAD